MTQTVSQPLKALYIEHQVNVSTYDVDFAGHVSNISYLRWLEDMRLKLFDKYFSLKEFLDDGKTPVIAATSIQYKVPVRLFDKPQGVMWISKMSRASLTITAQLRVNGGLTTTAEHVCVFIELDSGKAIRLPQVCVDTIQQANEIVPLP